MTRRKTRQSGCQREYAGTIAPKQAASAATPTAVHDRTYHSVKAAACTVMIVHSVSSVVKQHTTLRDTGTRIDRINQRSKD
jgi:hypothetical protein